MNDVNVFSNYSASLTDIFNFIFINFSVGPKIKPFQFPADLEEGMRSVVICAVLSGDPPITIHWLKDGSEISQELQSRIDMIDDYTSFLTFISVGPHHNGNYTCVAQNPATTINHTATMVVNGKTNKNSFLFI